MQEVPLARRRARRRSPSAPTLAHALVFDGPVNNLHEAPALGNGDLGALVQLFQNEFRLHLAKNDIWDARFDHVTAEHVVTQDDLRRLSRDYGFRLEGGAYDGKPVYDRQPPPGRRYVDHGPGWDKQPFPCPKPAGLIRILHSGSCSTKIHTVVDIRNGVVTAEFAMDFGWHGRARLTVEAFVDRRTNAVRLRLSQAGQQGGLRLCVEKPPDSMDASLPPPHAQAFDAWSGAVTQTIPAGHGAKAFAWHLAAAFPQPAAGRQARPVQAHPHRLWQTCQLQPGQTLEFTVAVATDRDGRGDALRRARALAAKAAVHTHARARTAHSRAWAAFWARSGLELADRELEKTWYRNLFALACQIRPGAMAPGLVGNIVPWDTSPWHGTFTVNMNTQKMFLAALPTNHPEWLDCYADWLEHMMPSFRHLAKTIFGLQGIYCPHMIFPYVPPERQANSNQAGRALGMTGWHGQPLWWRWECFRERRFLRQRAYPYFRAAACFYWRYLKKYLDASGDLYPSLNLEGPPWTRDFRHNRDPFIDLILFRNTFRYALEAARLLGVDAVWRRRWEWAAARIRPLRTEPLPDGHWWLYADRNDTPPTDPEWRQDPERRYGQAVAAAWAVFPGEAVAGDEPDGLAARLRDIMTHTRWDTIHMMTWIHHWWCAIPALRLGLPNAFAVARRTILRERFPAGHARTTQWIHLQPDAWRAPEDNYLGVVATTEMLLQSQGGVIRLFPCWPKRRRAAFRGFPARGGFLVSATLQPGTGLRAEIRSLAGEPCRVRWPAALALPRVTSGGRRVPVARAGRDILFRTRTGRSYTLSQSQLRRTTPQVTFDNVPTRGRQEARCLTPQEERRYERKGKAL